MERVIVGVLGFFLGLVLIEQLTAHLWLALVFAIVAGVVGRELAKRHG